MGMMKKVESGEKSPSDYSNPKRRMKAQNILDTKMMEENPAGFGKSEAEIQSDIDRTTQVANSKLQGAQAPMNRMVLGAQGFQVGDVNQATREMAEVIPEVVSQGSAQALATNQALIRAGVARTLGQMDTAAARKIQQNQYWGSEAIDIGKDLAEHAAKPLGLV